MNTGFDRFILLVPVVKITVRAAVKIEPVIGWADKE